MKTTERVDLKKHIDLPSLLVIALTLILFLAAIVVKGMGHDLLLEGGVFLVSVKLIIMAYKSSVATQTITEELALVRASMARLEATTAPSARTETGVGPSGRAEERNAL